MAGTLLERDGDLRVLDGALALVAQGQGGTVVVEGPPGIGKSGLLRAAVERAPEHGALVLTARCGELERDFAHGVVRQLFERLLHAADPPGRAQLLSGPAAAAAATLGAEADAPPAGDDPAFAILHGLYWLTANLVDDRPAVLVIDDLQWADGASLRFLSFLARRTDSLPVLVLGAVRSGATADADPALGTLLADPSTIRVTPHPLTEEGARALLQDRLHAPPADVFVRTCHEATGGNPFLLGQLADAAASAGIAPDAKGAEQVALVGPRTVGRSILLRLGEVPPPALQLARAVAVLAVATSPDRAAAVAELDLADAARAADDLHRTGLLGPGPELDFVHPLVRSAVYEDLSPAERAAAHARAVGALRAAGASPGELAPHLLGTAPAADPEIVRLLHTAATEALGQGASDIAARLLERALAEPPTPDLRDALRAELGIASLRAGDVVAADRHLTAAVEAAGDPVARAHLRVELAAARIGSADPEAALGVLQEALADAHAAGDGELALRVESELATMEVMAGGAVLAGDRLTRYGSLPGATQNERLLLCGLAREAYLTGRPAAQVADLARRGLAHGRLLAELGSASVVPAQAAFALALADAFEDAAAATAALLDDARRRGSMHGYGFASAGRGLLALRTGDVTAAEADGHAGVEAFRDHAVYQVIPLSLLLLALLERGEVGEAAGLLAHHDVDGAMPDVLPSNRILHARAAVRLAQGEIDTALADLGELAGRERRLGLVDLSVDWRLLAALGRHARDEREVACALADEQVALARTLGAPTTLGRALRVRGVVGDDLELLQQAVAVLGASGGRLETAHCQVDLGIALRRRGRRNDAQEALRVGLDLARRCHATALTERATEELTAAGARPRRLQFSGADALTASERRVAELAAAGRTNREIAQALFVTAKTVENHLSRVYAKLGIGSRTDLAAALDLAGAPA